MKLNYFLLVTGPAYGSQNSSSAYQFSQALLFAGHRISSVFFYCDGVLNANKFTTPAKDEFDLVRLWSSLAKKYRVPLNVCVASALRRGVIEEQESMKKGLPISNMQPEFTISALGALAASALLCDRMVQF